MGSQLPRQGRSPQCPGQVFCPTGQVCPAVETLAFKRTSAHHQLIHIPHLVITLSLPWCSVLRKQIQPGQQPYPHPRALQLPGKSRTLKSFLPVLPCRVKAFSPLISGELHLDVAGKEGWEGGQALQMGLSLCHKCAEGAPVSSRLHKGTITYTAEILPSIPSKLKLAMGLFHLFKSTCLIWHN